MRGIFAARRSLCSLAVALFGALIFVIAPQGARGAQDDAPTLEDPTPLSGATAPTLHAADNQWVIANERLKRVIRYDPVRKGFFAVSLKDRATGKELLDAPAAEGVFEFGGLQTPERTISLGRDFEPGKSAHVWKANPDVRGGGVWTLSLTAKGVGSNAGFNVTIHYDVYPGREPWMTKWYTIDNKTGSDLVWRTLTYECLPLANRKSLCAFQFDEFSTLCLAHDRKQHRGIGVAVGHYEFDTCLDPKEGLVARVRPNVDLDEYLKLRGGTTTKSIIEIYSGPPESGTWTHQLFLIHRWIAKTDPTRPGTWYSTYRGIGGIDPTTDHIKAVAPKVKACGFDGIFSCTLFHRYFDRPRLGQTVAPDVKQKWLAEYVRQADICKRHGLSIGLHTYGGDSYANCCPAQMDEAARVIGDILHKTSAQYLWYEDFGRPYSCLGKVQTGLEGWQLQKNSDSSDRHGTYRDDHKFAWREGWMRLAPRLQAASPGIVLHRSWISLAEALDTGEITTAKDIGDNCTRKSMDAWRDFMVRRAAIWPILANVPGAGGTVEGSDYELANSAFIGTMMLAGNVLKIDDSQVSRVRHWIEWNRKNRYFLQYSQPLDGAAGVRLSTTLATTKARVGGLMHLAPLRNGSFGFVGLWNTDDRQARQVKLRISPRTYFLSIDPAQPLSIVGLRDGAEYPYEWDEGAIHLLPFEIPAAQWEILELREIKGLRIH